MKACNRPTRAIIEMMLMVMLSMFMNWLSSVVRTETDAESAVEGMPAATASRDYDQYDHRHRMPSSPEACHSRFFMTSSVSRAGGEHREPLSECASTHRASALPLRCIDDIALILFGDRRAAAFGNELSSPSSKSGVGHRLVEATSSLVTFDEAHIPVNRR